VAEHRIRGRVLITLGVTVVVAAIVGGLLFAQRWADRRPDPKSVEEALEEYERSTTSGVAHVEVGMPTPGVYVYEGDGLEELSVLASTQDQGPTLPATVTVDGRCFTFRIAYNEHHAQEWRLCRRDGKLVEVSGTTEQEFDFVAFTADDETTLTCDPPGVRVDPADEPGDRRRQSCEGVSARDGSSTISDAVNIFVGVETLTIGGSEVETLHYRQRSTVTGDRNGTSTEEIWFDAETMLPVRQERTIRVDSPAPAPLNQVTYREEGWFQATSLTPTAHA
jgi:hypothetical protein